MGVLDSEAITLTCPNCGVTESSRIRDKGNGYSGSAWERPSFDKFDIDVTVTSTCQDCKVAANVVSRYGT